MRGNALDGLGASIMTKYFNKTELVSMPLHGLSLSKAKKAKKKHYLCFNALARAKSITEWKHWTFPKKSFNALTRAKCMTNLHKNYPSQSFYLSAYPHYTSKFPVRQSSFNKFYGIFSHSLHLPLVRTSPFLSADCGLSSTNL